MSKATYRDIPSKLANREAFQGNSMSAHWVGDCYHVLSYDTIIGVYDSNSGNWVVFSNYHSRTTSRHQNLVEAWGVGGAR